jgi:glycine/D-amino acid oxidase-like deaminating enzyme
MLKEQVYWHDTAAMPSDNNLPSLPSKVDIAIIGGGYTGLSAARTLAKQGSRVAVLEAETIGWGASSRNGGMTLTGLKLPIEAIVKRYGHVQAQSLFQASLEAIHAVEQILREEKIDCGFARHGHLVVANKPRHYKALIREAEFMAKEFSYRVTTLSEMELETEIGSDLYFGGLVDEASGGLNPAQYAVGLAKTAEKAGAVLCARARLNQIEKRNKDFRLVTGRGAVVADKVLIATSGYTGPAAGALQRKIIPIGSYMIATEPLSPELARELIPHGRMVFDYRHYLNYYRLSADNRLLFGGRAAFFPESPRTTRESAAILRREMTKIFPQLEDVNIEYAWGGTLDFAFDMMPHVGESEGIFYSLGYAGHGVAMATYLGKTVAEAMLTGKIKEHPFAAYPFPDAPLGLYDGRPWFLPLVGMWFKLLDWIE